MASTHSRNSIRRAVAVLVVLLIGIGGSGYTHVNDKNGRKLKTEGAQIYANDDQSSGVVYTLEPGDEYQLLDVDEQWCRIRVEKDDVEGYALVIELDLDVDEILAALNETEDEAETVEAVIETAAEPTVEPTEEPTAEPTEEPIEEATEAPAGDATQAPEDTATEEPTEDATEQPTAEPTADATEAPAEPDEGDEIEREYDATHTPAPEKRVGAVDADELNVYAQADESSDVVMTLERDDEVEILGEEGAFLLVSADDWQGYALAECIYELSHDEQAALKTMWGTAVVTASSLNVRKTGSTSASLLYKIKSGQRVMLRGVDGDWYCIETESGKGYVLGDHLTVNAITGTSYKQGAKGDDVKELQRRLIELKYLTGTADGSFGASTKTAVKAFQKDAGLTADGVVGTGTLNKLFALGEIKFDEEYTTLSYGDSGDAVLKLQRRLRELGYMTANATGMFGTATKSALVDFQKAAGLTADGAAGNATQVALYAANAPAKGANTISGTLKVGDKGTAVTELQKRLI
ncbi:MAG: peptidoglycan-binding protein, partial [Christensenellales bacterium]